MDNLELNEKLAKWAGFRQLPVGKSGFHWERCQRVGNWMPPEGTETWQSRDHLPNFTESLDACFKWLVPKLEETKKRIEYSVDFSMPDFGKPANHYWAILQGSHQLVGTGEDKDPALAFCLAIEELIDKI